MNDQVNREIGENEIRNKEKVPNCYKQDGPRLNKHVPRSQVLERGVILIMKTDLGFEKFNLGLQRPRHPNFANRGLVFWT